MNGSPVDGSITGRVAAPATARPPMVSRGVVMVCVAMDDAA